jgi:uncharacterized membrane-anchored protein YhcB (DUF1043 family)
MSTGTIEVKTNGKHGMTVIEFIKLGIILGGLIWGFASQAATTREAAKTQTEHMARLEKSQDDNTKRLEKQIGDVKTDLKDVSDRLYEHIVKGR